MECLVEKWWIKWNFIGCGKQFTIYCNCVEVLFDTRSNPSGHRQIRFDCKYLHGELFCSFSLFSHSSCASLCIVWRRKKWFDVNILRQLECGRKLIYSTVKYVFFSLRNNNRSFVVWITDEKTSKIEIEKKREKRCYENTEQRTVEYVYCAYENSYNIVACHEMKQMKQIEPERETTARSAWSIMHTSKRYFYLARLRSVREE